MTHFLTSNALLKCIALYIGYSLWFMINQHQDAQLWVEIPLSFYQVPIDMIIQAPEKILVALQAKKQKLQTLDLSNLAAHIDASKFIIGPNQLTLSEDLLLLPTSFKVTEYIPHNSIIYGKTKQST